MQDLKRVSALGIVLLVVLRLSIGWQLLYEGLWKINSKQTPRPWTAAGYLKNANGPFRDLFRDMTGDFSNMQADPDDLGWLDYDTVENHWNEWHARFLAHHPDLSDKQKGDLANKLNGPKAIAWALEKLPAGVDLNKVEGVAKGVISYDAKNKRLVVDGKLRMTPKEKAVLLELAPIVENPTSEQEKQNAENAAFRKAIEELDKRTSRLSFKQRLAVLLKADPDRVARVYAYDLAGKREYEETAGEITRYKDTIARYNAELADADTAFKQEHLTKLGLPDLGTLAAMRSKVVGPVKALDAELKDAGKQILTVEQLARGPVPEGPSNIAKTNQQTIWALTILGFCLMAGLATRPAAFIAACMILSFYLVWPPWPGVVEAPGPEHSLFVNKNFIEVVALLAIAAMPTGRWFGVDAIFARIFGGSKKNAP